MNRLEKTADGAQTPVDSLADRIEKTPTLSATTVPHDELDLRRGVAVVAIRECTLEGPWRIEKVFFRLKSNPVRGVRTDRTRAQAERDAHYRKCPASERRPRS